MKTLIILTALVSLGTANSQPLSKQDRDKAVKYLEQTRDGVTASVKGLSDAQMKWKSAPDRWSVAETLEHIAKAEDLLMQNITANVMKAPAAPAEGRDNARIDALVLAAIPDRSRKAQAPEPLVPAGTWTPAETLDHFLKSRASTVSFAESTEGLRDHAVDSPIGQKLDGYQWLLFIAAHSERHTKQILEVKADPNFPKP
ncbi:MAG TPA: DinB family protein [Candidatus Solibacter sp.]|nr:DinB family protein [Candidatus Solibacter sp.]